MSTGKTYSTKYLLDSNNNRGAEGQVLSTTSTGIDWVDANTVPGTGLWLANGNDIYNSNSGDVVVGGTSSNYKFGVTGGHIGVSNGGNIYVGGFGADAVIGYLGNTSGVFTLRSDNNRDISIGSGTVNNSVFIEGSNGNVGIGTTLPGTRRLSVVKNTSITSGFNDIVEFLDTTIGGGGSVSVNFGRENSNKNVGKITFKYSSDGSSDNSLNLGFFGADNLVTLLADGNLGVGTNDPLSRLHVLSREIGNGANKGIRIENYNGSKDYSIRTGVSGYENTSLAFYDETAGANRIVINSNGNVGIGTVTPSQSLEVSGTIKSISTGAAHLILNGDTNNSGDTGQVDSIIDFLGDGNPGIYGYRINTENWSGQTALHFQEYLNGSYTSRLFISKDGNVGIGITNPILKLHIEGTNSLPATSGTAQNGGIRIENGVNNGVLDIGASNATGAPGWLQATDKADLSQAYKLLLNPNGGNVGIGTTSPEASLQIGGAVATSSEKLDVRGNSSGNYVASFEQDHVTGYGVLIDTDGTLVGEPALKIKNSSSELFYVGSNGNVGIGNTGPTSQLQVGPGTSNASRSLIASLGGTENGVLSALSLVNTSGNDVIGYGVGIDFHLASTYSPTGRIATIAEDTGVKAGMAFYTYESGNFDERIRISSAGAIKFNAYDSTNNTGTPTYLLGTDATGNVVKTLSSTAPGSLWLANGNDIYNSNSGSVGIGVTSLSDWGWIIDHALQFANGAFVAGRTDSTAAINLGSNAFVTATGGNAWKYFAAGAATRYIQQVGEHYFQVAGVGAAAGDTITWSTALNIANNGNVGIGVTGPTKTLHVVSAAEAALFQGTATWGTGIQIDATATGGRNFQIQSSADAAGEGGGKFLIVDRDATGTPTRLSIDSSGNVGIGTNDPVQTLQVNGQVLFRTTTVDGGKNRFQLIPGGSSDAANLYLYYGNTGDGTLSVRINAQGDSYLNGGNVGIGTTSPAAKLHVLGSVILDSYSVSDPDPTSRAAYPAGQMFTHYSEANGVSIIGGQGGYSGASLTIGEETTRSSNFKFIRGISDTNGGGNAAEEFWVNGIGGAYFAGNVGIGTTSPSNKLAVCDSNGTGLEIAPNDTSEQVVVLSYDRGQTAYRRINFNALDYIFRTSATERMRITSAGTLLLRSGAFPTNQDSPFLYRIGGGSLAIGSATETGSGAYVALYTNSLERMRITSAGNVGIGVTTPNAPLQFSNAITTRKVVLYEMANNNNQFYGFGVEAAKLVYSTANTGDDHVFYAGASSTSRNELIRIDGSNGDIKLSPSSRIILDDTPAASTASGSGTIVKWSVSDATTAGTLYTVKTNGLWTPVDADNEATSIGMLAIALGSNATDGMLLQGFFYKASHGFTIGLPLYISNTAGAFTTTKPTGTNDYVRIIGYATSTNYIYFDPDKTWVQVA